MKKFRKIVISTLLAAALSAISILSPFTAYAAMSNRIAFGDPTAHTGENFDVTMKVYALSGGNLGSATITLSYDTKYIEFVSGTGASGGAGTLVVKGLNNSSAEWDYVLKFKALAPGQTSITVKDSEIYDTDMKAGTLDKKGSSSITIEGSAVASGTADASLSTLQISPGFLTPDFSPEVTEYSVVVGDDCDKIRVSAPATDKAATVVITGNGDLKVGDNEIICKVTADDGSTVKNYVIKVSKQQGIKTPQPEGSGASSSSLTATVNGKEYKIADSFDDTLVPDGFTATTYDYKGTSVKAAQSADKNITLLYLIGTDGSEDFFVYDGNSDVWSAYALLNVAQKSFTIVPLGKESDVPAGLKETTLELNGKKVRGWVSENDPDQQYCIVYAMNQDGETNFYRYDMKEKTIQRFFEELTVSSGETQTVLSADAEDYNSLVKDYDNRGKLLIALSIVCVILLITLIIVLIISNRKTPTPKNKKPVKRERDYEPFESDSIRETPRQSTKVKIPERSVKPSIEDDDFETLDL